MFLWSFVKTAERKKGVASVLTIRQRDVTNGAKQTKPLQQETLLRVKKHLQKRVNVRRKKKQTISVSKPYMILKKNRNKPLEKLMTSNFSLTPCLKYSFSLRPLSSLASSLQKFSLNTTGQQCSTVSPRQHWFTPSASLKETGTQQLMTAVSVLQGACSNVITVIQKFQDSLFVCGTNGNKPRCWKLVSVCTCLMFGPLKGAVFLEIAVIGVFF